MFTQVFWQILTVLLSIVVYKQYEWRHSVLPSFNALVNSGSKQSRNSLQQQQQQEYDIDGNVKLALSKLYPSDFYSNATDLILPLGSTRYYYFGSDRADAQTLVFIHGISFPSPGFKRLASKLSRNYRILLYDLYGRGYSDGPHVDHDDALYISQLSMILLHAGVQKFHLIGFSLGGSIAIQFTSYFHHMIQSLVLLAPAGLLDELPLPGKLVRVPLLGEAIMYSLGARVMVKGSYANFKVKPELDLDHLCSQSHDFLSDNSTLQEDVSYFYELIKLQTLYHPSYKRSFLSTTRHFSICNKQKILERLSVISDETHRHLPVTLIWGTEDNVVPYHLHEDIKKFIPRSKLVSIDSAGHNIIAENATAVIDALQNHLQRYSQMPKQ
ncbi:hypothetical protein MIR68_007581 [Amoeboaphelidium protococcarum]|nr:hypothetical protein MIR68_007581 [Amoeboaphelidium protococcarum]